MVLCVFVSSDVRRKKMREALHRTEWKSERKKAIKKEIKKDGPEGRSTTISKSTGRRNSCANNQEQEVLSRPLLEIDPRMQIRSQFHRHPRQGETDLLEDVVRRTIEGEIVDRSAADTLPSFPDPHGPSWTR